MPHLCKQLYMGKGHSRPGRGWGGVQFYTLLLGKLQSSHLTTLSSRLLPRRENLLCWSFDFFVVFFVTGILLKRLFSACYQTVQYRFEMAEKLHQMCIVISSKHFVVHAHLPRSVGTRWLLHVAVHFAGCHPGVVADEKGLFNVRTYGHL